MPVGAEMRGKKRRGGRKRVEREEEKIYTLFNFCAFNLGVRLDLLRLRFSSGPLLLGRPGEGLVLLLVPAQVPEDLNRDKWIGLE